MWLTLVFDGALFHQTAAQQIIGRGGDNSDFFKTARDFPTLRVAGFAPRQFNR